MSDKPPDYHDAGRAHTHSPHGQVRRGGRGPRSKRNYYDNGTKQTNALKRNSAGKSKTESGSDYHDVGYAHTHSPENKRTDYRDNGSQHTRPPRRRTVGKTKTNIGVDYHDVGFVHTHSPMDHYFDYY